MPSFKPTPNTPGYTNERLLRSLRTMSSKLPWSLLKLPLNSRLISKDLKAFCTRPICCIPWGSMKSLWKSINFYCSTTPSVHKFCTARVCAFWAIKDTNKPHTFSIKYSHLTQPTANVPSWTQTVILCKKSIIRPWSTWIKWRPKMTSKILTLSTWKHLATTILPDMSFASNNSKRSDRLTLAMFKVKFCILLPSIKSIRFKNLGEYADSDWGKFEILVSKS